MKGQTTMDPNACYMMMTDPEASADDRRSAAYALVDWLDCGGFAPLGLSPQMARANAVEIIGSYPY